VNLTSNKYPYCIVWNSIPFYSWYFSFLGHAGICTSDGAIHNFATHRNILIGHLALSNKHPMKVI
jgi:hypothetical protein